MLLRYDETFTYTLAFFNNWPAELLSFLHLKNPCSADERLSLAKSPVSAVTGSSVQFALGALEEGQAKLM